jgi:hypothetical protein
MLIIKFSKYLTTFSLFLMILTANLLANEKESPDLDYFQANPIIAEINGKKFGLKIFEIKPRRMPHKHSMTNWQDSFQT